MATAKKKPVAKKTVAKQPATKTVKKKVAPKKSVAVGRSFKRTEETMPFMTFKPTTQTAYWLILSMLVLALGVWVLYLNAKVQNIYDQIELNDSLNNSMIIPSESHADHKQ